MLRRTFKVLKIFAFCLLFTLITSSFAIGANIPVQQGKVLGQNETEEAESQNTFEDGLKEVMPLSKEQIQVFRELSHEREQALTPVPATLRSRTVSVILEPGHIPVKVLTTANVATSLIFHDSTGQPWPITSVTIGSPTFFQILRPDLVEGNLLNIIPLKAYGSSTLIVTLVKKDIPLVIHLEADSIRSPKRIADALVLFQLSHHGPNAQIPIIKNIKETTNSDMLAFLDRVPPPDASKVAIKPKDQKIAVWKLNDKYYIRTVHTLMWPAWMSVVNGAGDVKCYEAPITPRILISQNGSIYPVTLKENRD